MKKEQYLATQELLLALSRQILMLPLKKFIEAIDLAETLGPVLDPTLYRQGADNLSAIRVLARAARKFQQEIERVRDDLTRLQEVRNDPSGED